VFDVSFGECPAGFTDEDDLVRTLGGGDGSAEGEVTGSDHPHSRGVGGEQVVERMVGRTGVADDELIAAGGRRHDIGHRDRVRWGAMRSRNLCE
jgi:hypothetical protein